MRRARLGAAISILVASAGVLAAEPKAPGSEAMLMGRVDRFMRAEMQRQQVPGASLGIVRRGGAIVVKGYGEANVELKVPVTGETVFQSGSLGKQFTATAVMLLVQDGRLSLEDSITRYFPDAPATWRPITIRRLLTHTSGIPDYESQVANSGGDAKVIDYRRDYTEEELTRIAYALPLSFPPGSRWSYSNTGYVLLGVLIHKVSGQFYGDLLEERVFAPLGMKTARVISEADIVAHRAAGYRLAHGELKNQEWVSPTLNSTADGSLYLSMRDFIAWDRGLREHAVLTAGSWEQIYTPVRLESGKTYPYGFGWDVDTSKGRPWYHHGGSWQGFKTYISRYLADDLTIIVLTNLADAVPERFVDGVARILDPQLSQLEPTTPIPDSDPSVAARARTLLAAAGEGKLAGEDLPAAQPEAAAQMKEYQELLRPLGALRRLELLDRRELGDDRVSTFAAVYAERTLKVRLALAPNDRVAEFTIDEE
jgi:CubicO group peptidase (beta-lactamase class C family)